VEASEPGIRSQLTRECDGGEMETKQTQRQKYAPWPATELISELSAPLHTVFFFGGAGVYQRYIVCIFQIGGGDLPIPDTDESTFKFFACFCAHLEPQSWPKALAKPCIFPASQGIRSDHRIH